MCVAAGLRRRVDAVQICNPPDILFVPALVLRAFGAALIFDHHDLTPELVLAKGIKRSRWQYRLTAALERCTFAACDVSIATNESYRSVALARGRMDPDRVFVVRSGPDEDRFRTVSPERIDEVATAKASGMKLVAYVGVLGKQEGIADLLEIARIVRDEMGRADICFVIAGSGPELPELRLRVERCQQEHYVHLLGRISEGRLLYLLDSADVCVNPDTPNELNDMSTMNKIMEYMAFAKPIVQFDLHEGRVSAGAASLYARRGDLRDFAAQICHLCDDRAKARAMGEAGRARFHSALSWRYQVDPLLAAYRRALAVRGGADEAPKSSGGLGRGPGFARVARIRVGRRVK